VASEPDEEGALSVTVMATSKLWNGGQHEIGFDPQASFGITAERELFGGNLSKRVNFELHDWAGKVLQEDTHGRTAFGPMIFSQRASGTILCAADFYRHWDLRWEGRKMAFRAINCLNRKLVLHFSENRQKLLTCVPSQGQWEQLCSPSIITDDWNIGSGDQTGEIRRVLATQEYERAWESIRFHECTCHASFNTLRKALKRNVLRDATISERDVENVAIATDFGECLACQVGKSKQTSRQPRTVREEEVPRPEAPAVDEPPELRSTTLGIDLMYVQQRAYLIAVSKQFGYVHVVPVERREKGIVGKALKSIFDDYKANQASVLDWYNEAEAREAREAAERARGRSSSIMVTPPVTRVESDNEGAFVAAAINVLPVYGITPVFVASGEHVTYAERQILTVKERISATEAAFGYNLPDKVLDGLVVNCANWMNVLPCAKSPESAWASLTRRRVSYKDLTIAKWGAAVVAHRPDKSLAKGMASGELGISLGPSLTHPGAIHFYSLSSKQVKLRKRFVLAAPIDLCEYGFTRNPHAVKQGNLQRGYQEYLSRRPTVADGGEAEGPGIVPADGSYLTPMAAAQRVADIPSTEGEWAAAAVRTPVPATPRSAPPSHGRAEEAQDAAEEFVSRLARPNAARRLFDNEQALHMGKNLAQVLDRQPQQQNVSGVPPAPPSTPAGVTGTTVPSGTGGVSASQQLDPPSSVAASAPAPAAAPAVPQRRRQPSRQAKTEHQVVKVAATVMGKMKYCFTTRAVRRLVLRAMGKIAQMIGSEMELDPGTIIYGWGRAVAKLGKPRAAPNILAELTQIFVDHDVCEPVDKDFTPDDWHGTVEIYTVKHDRDSTRISRQMTGMAR
jgi:hypothetical protein